MNRRTIVRALAVSAGIAAVPSGMAQTQNEPSPEANAHFPPIQWNLVSIDAEDTAITPDDPSRYWVQFLDDGLVYINADCNSASGSYRIEDDSIMITDIISTLVLCGENSIDQEFLSALSAATAYSISSDGSDQLVLSIGDNETSALFSASLAGVVWELEQFAAGNGSVITPDSPERYTLEFLDDGTVEVVADCNLGTSEAPTNGNEIDMTITATLMDCGEGSMSDDFIRILNDASEFVIMDGRLHLSLPMDAGIATFRAVPPRSGDRGATPEA